MSWMIQDSWPLYYETKNGPGIDVHNLDVTCKYKEIAGYVYETKNPEAHWGYILWEYADYLLYNELIQFTNNRHKHDIV